MDEQELKCLEKSAVEAFAAGLVGLYEQLGMTAVIREMAATVRVLEDLQNTGRNGELGRTAVAHHLLVAAAAEKARSARQRKT